MAAPSRGPRESKDFYLRASTTEESKSTETLQQQERPIILRAQSLSPYYESVRELAADVELFRRSRTSEYLQRVEAEDHFGQQQGQECNPSYTVDPQALARWAEEACRLRFRDVAFWDSMLKEVRKLEVGGSENLEVDSKQSTEGTVSLEDQPHESEYLRLPGGGRRTSTSTDVEDYTANYPKINSTSTSSTFTSSGSSTWSRRRTTTTTTSSLKATELVRILWACHRVGFLHIRILEILAARLGDRHAFFRELDFRELARLCLVVARTRDECLLQGKSTLDLAEMIASLVGGGGAGMKAKKDNPSVGARGALDYGRPSSSASASTTSASISTTRSGVQTCERSGSSSREQPCGSKSTSSSSSSPFLQTPSLASLVRSTTNTSAVGEIEGGAGVSRQFSTFTTSWSRGMTRKGYNYKPLMTMTSWPITWKSLVVRAFTTITISDKKQKAEPTDDQVADHVLSNRGKGKMNGEGSGPFALGASARDGKLKKMRMEKNFLAQELKDEGNQVLTRMFEKKNQLRALSEEILAAVVETLRRRELPSGSAVQMESASGQEQSSSSNRRSRLRPLFASSSDVGEESRNPSSRMLPSDISSSARSSTSLTFSTTQLQPTKKSEEQIDELRTIMLGQARDWIHLLTGLTLVDGLANDSQDLFHRGGRFLAVFFRRSTSHRLPPGATSLLPEVVSIYARARMRHTELLDSVCDAVVCGSVPVTNMQLDMLRIQLGQLQYKDERIEELWSCRVLPNN
ncbi:unnamed protein product [Amoebophrya sp. A25]|nr:unnamed protein product [Amoebophrya sp. A25]|eukprot:GSA25T00023935001.1